MAATASFDPATFPTVSRGNGFEDFAVGDTFEHHWGRTITAGDNSLFSTATCWWSPMFLNSEFARAHGHPATVVNPMLVLCIAVGMSVEDLSEAGGAFLGLDDCVFHQPVYPNDTIRARSTVIEARGSDSRRDSGFVSWTTQILNQRDEVVGEFRRTNRVIRRARP